MGRDAEWEAASVLAAALGVGLLVTFIEPGALVLGLPLALVLAAVVVARLPMRLAREPLLSLTYQVAAIAILLTYVAGLLPAWSLALVIWLGGATVVVLRASTSRPSSRIALAVRTAGLIPVTAHVLAVAVIYVNIPSEFFGASACSRTETAVILSSIPAALILTAVAVRLWLSGSWWLLAVPFVSWAIAVVGWALVFGACYTGY